MLKDKIVKSINFYFCLILVSNCFFLRCKPGFFGKDANLTSGCLQCFCFGHSADCKNSKNFVPVILESDLIEWTASDANGNSFFVGEDQSNGIFVNNQDKEVWFNAPSN